MSNYNNEYNPEKDINEIAWLKQVYTNGNESDKKWASTEANKYYNNLIQNGYGAEADILRGSDSGQAYNFSKGYVKNYDGQKFADNYRENANRAYDEQLKATISAYENQKSQIKSQYNDGRKALDASYLKAQKLLPQQLAAQGITGGASESANLQLNNEYMNNIYNHEKQKALALNEIDSAIASAKYNVASQKANAENNYAQMAYNISKDQRDYYTTQRNYNDSMNFQREQYDFNQALSYAANLGDFNYVAKLLGTTPEKAKQTWINMIRFQNDPNGLNAMQVHYNVNKPYSKSYNQSTVPDDDRSGWVDGNLVAPGITFN